MGTLRVCFISVGCLVIVALLSGAPQGNSEPPTMVLAGTIKGISGDDITIAALNNPKFTKTIHLDSGTRIFRGGGTMASRSVLAIGVVIVARQVTSGGSIHIVRVDYYGPAR